MLPECGRESSVMWPLCIHNARDGLHPTNDRLHRSVGHRVHESLTPVKELRARALHPDAQGIDDNGPSRLKLRFSQTFSISRKEPVEQPLTLDNPPALTRDQIKSQW
jgi:hypothetical protein